MFKYFLKYFLEQFMVKKSRMWYMGDFFTTSLEQPA